MESRPEKQRNYQYNQEVTVKTDAEREGYTFERLEQ